MSGTVLIAMHYQNEVLHPEGRIKVGISEKGVGREQLKERVSVLLAFARASSIPVISVRIAFQPDHSDVIQNCKIFRDVVKNGAMIDGSWGAEFHEGLGPLPGEHVIKHTRTNAFYGSQLEEILRVLEARTLIMAGIATNSVVSTSVAHAADVGYNVIVAADACSSGNSVLHEACLENMRLIAEVRQVDAIIGELGLRATQ